MDIWGDVDVRSGLPDVEVHSDVVLSPFKRGLYIDNDPNWGVYDRSGSLIDAAAYKRRGRDLVGQSRRLDLVEASTRRLPPDDYIYGGVLITHFGHFLCTSIARLWGLSMEPLGKRKLLFHSYSSFEKDLALPFVKGCMAALGVPNDQVIIIDEPMVAPRLIIPRPSFEEQNFVHTAYRSLCHRVGEFHRARPRTLLGRLARGLRRPVYLSKARFQQGINRITNEHLVEDELRRRGVTICYPESLPLASQFRLFSERRVILGAAGSAFHASAFSPPAARIHCLVPSGNLNANLALVDQVNANRSTYYRPLAETLEETDRASFSTTLTLRDPKGVAQDLLDLAHAGMA